MCKNLPIVIAFFILNVAFTGGYAEDLGTLPAEQNEIAARGGHGGGHRGGHGGGHRGGHHGRHGGHGGHRGHRGHHGHHRGHHRHGHHGHHRHHWHGHHWRHNHWDRHWNAVNYWGPGHSWRHWYWYGGGLGAAAAAGYFYDPNYYWSSTTPIAVPYVETDSSVPIESGPLVPSSTTTQPLEINVHTY